MIRWDKRLRRRPGEGGHETMELWNWLLWLAAAEALCGDEETEFRGKLPRDKNSGTVGHAYAAAENSAASWEFLKEVTSFTGNMRQHIDID